MVLQSESSDKTGMYLDQSFITGWPQSSESCTSPSEPRVGWNNRGSFARFSSPKEILGRIKKAQGLPYIMDTLFGSV